MPLVDLGHGTAGTELPRAERDATTQPIVVFGHGGESVGLLVDRIVDIVEQSVQTNRMLKRPGILGSVIVQGRVVELLDVDGLLGEFDLPKSAARGRECA
jgi:two-component system chemotaxis sensor kinase CheA